MVPASSISIIVFNILFSVALPFSLFLFIRRKSGAGLRPFLIGCAVWIVFAMILEQGLHALVLSTAAGALIQSKTLYYAVYGGLAAGLFEESGRFIVMKTVMKKDYGQDGTAFMYGAGHGGIEVLVVLGIVMVNNLIYSILCNTGHLELLTAPLTEAQEVQFQAVIDQLVTYPSLMFLAAPLERISALILHIALSVIVWLCVTRRKYWLFPLAIFLHFAMDAGSVLLSKSGVNTWLVELAILAFSTLTALCTYSLWKKSGK